MINLAEESNTQVLMGVSGVFLVLLGCLFLGFALLTAKVIREEREKGNHDAAQKVRRTRKGSIVIGVLLIGFGGFLFFF
ncbi:hypothetical protein OHA79_16875 [Streptomyces sp. NBC_00841]|uniref:hypothetical protein n=1 Tax=unclassified Streptomyces TaxID=2593676 RepID=UPI00225399C5|nr:MULTISPECIES: hypothetical protein [unclassified Streptomyces]MCX4535333.1 hypothetical protein [Streptomyces sp. NBC_01669]WRZ99365.1 hypothetical protein OHA79_16875 [Streptomyces sp. NBC_00841]